MSQHFSPHGVYGNHNASPYLHPAAKAARAVLVGCLIAVPMTTMLAVSEAYAQQSVVRSYVIAPSALGTALSNFAAAADITLSFDADQTRGKQSAGLTGQYSVEAGLRALLVGSGLQAVHLQNGNYVLRESVERQSTTADAVLPAVTVAAKQMGDLPPAYAGGQIARGGSLGLMGNTDVVDSPFSQTSFTAELIQNSQAQTLGDVLEASPSVRRNGSRFNQNDTYSMRGFPTTVGNDISYDGMYGLTNTRRNAIEGIERVEVLRGPSALLNGVPATGSIGGSINLVPKRPTADPLTELTLSYADASQAGMHLDMSRRFGTDQRFGIRTNLAHREGSTQFDYNRDKASHGSVALDYIGDRLRLFAHLNQEDQRIDAPLFGALALGAGVAVPAAPDGRRNFMPRFNYTDSSRLVGLARAEYDFSKSWTGSIGYGEQRIDETQVVSSGQVLLNGQGDYSRPTRNRLTQSTRDGQAIDAKLQGEFFTGPVKHRLVFGYSGFVFDQQIDTYTLGASGGNSNIYNPNPNAVPTPVFNVVPTSVAQRLNFNGLAVADTLHFFENRLLLTLGVRRQQIKVINDGTVAYDRGASSPSVGLVVKPWKNWSLYGNYIEGLSQGQQAPAGANNEFEIFPPFVSKQHEVGIKHDSGRLLTTLALFEITRPSAYLDTATNFFMVGGEQRNRGLELETFGEIARGIRFIGGFTLTDAKLTKTANGVNQGNNATDVPRFAATAGVEWDTPLMPGLTITARSIYTGSQYINQANTQEIPSWTRYDVGARYRFNTGSTPVTIRAGITNLFDSKYFESTRLFTGAQRTFSLSTTFSF